MTATMYNGVGNIEIDKYAEEAVNKYQQQRDVFQAGSATGGLQMTGGQQLSAEEQARFFGSVGKWFAEDVLPVALPIVTKLLTGQQRALGMPETRGGDEEQRFLLDFAKKALQVVIPVAQQALQTILTPRQRDINEDAATTDRFAFLAPFIPALIGAAGSALGSLLGGRRGPLTLDNDQDRAFLSQFTTECWNTMLRPNVLNSLKPILANIQRPAAPAQPQQPQQPQQPGF